MGIHNISDLSNIGPRDFDAEDVPTVIETHTDDGPGFESEDELPESDRDAEDRN